MSARVAAVTRWIAASAVAALVAPSQASACPVCGGGGANAQAYLDMTIFLSLLPLGILGGFAGVVWYLYRQAEQSTRDLASPRELPRRAPAPRA